MMVSENLDLVRSILAAWERGDYGATDWAHQEIEYIWADGVSQGSVKGIAAMEVAWGEFLRDWVDFRVRADDFRAVNEGRVLVLNSFGGRAKTSGVGVGDLMTKGASVFVIADGRVTRLQLYWNRDRALADLGLEE